ncbi:outer dense fiber protein 2-like [Centroberyx affinis]|uniref:outer dense fiber protein 2-like n=1 Tax=Centroberyx affinis TaxID=166261 RepID=UPI003A5BA5E9
MKTRDSPPPVHVHVPEKTPVHVHMRRSPSPQKRIKDAQMKGDGESHHSPVRSKARAPWIPPGRTPTRRDLGSYKWQDAEERLGCGDKRVSKIDRLMMDAEPPETESALQAKRSGAQQQWDGVSGLQRDTEEQEDEPQAASKTLSVLLREQDSNRRLKKSESGCQRESDLLLRALVEAEIDGVTVANQLKETIDSLAKDKRLSKMNAASLGRQQELLLEKIEIFDNTNHSLRELLREWREHEKESLVSSEQKDSLRKRLADSEAENIQLLAKLTSKEKEASKLAEHLDFEKDNVKTTEELSKVLESTRIHLESQLNRREAEKSRLAAQTQKLQQSHGRQQQEIQALQEEIQALRQQRGEEQERRAQDAAALLTRQAEELQEKESQLAQALSTSNDWCSRHSEEAAARGQLEEEAAALKTQLSELSSQLHTAEERSRREREELLDRLHGLSADHASAELDNHRLKASLISSEETLGALQSEARRIQTSVRKHEGLVDKYKTKVQQARLESEEHRLRLDLTQKEARDVKVSLERELERVRRELLGRLAELEPLPDRLRRAELRLREARDEADAHERRSAAQSSALSDVRHKVEQQGARLETFQQKNLLLQEENNVLKEKIESLERKLEEMSVENREMSRVVSVKEASVRSLQQQLEERGGECSFLSRQLEQTLSDTRRQVDDSLQRALSKERASQSKALDLESQLSIAKTELSQLLRGKEEMERRLQSQLKNMKDRLEQSDSTNRSLNNYVQFLKASYGNVFGDSLVSS